jgi:hypothetical protein
MASDMTTIVPPTKYVRCVYTTVLISKATRYFAVAPVKQYERILAKQLSRDVAAMVSANTDAAACCSEGGNTNTSATSTSAPTFSAASSLIVAHTTPCVCLVNSTLLKLNRRFADQNNLLGLTFEVLYAVYEYADGGLNAIDPAPTVSASLPFTWSLWRRRAFPNIVANLFYLLTRKTYLSELAAGPNVFAHVTIDEVEMLLRSSYAEEDETAAETTSIDPVTRGRLTHTSSTAGLARGGATPLQWWRRGAETLNATESDVDYCTILRGPLSRAYASAPTMTNVQEISSNGTTVTRVYPLDVVAAAQEYKAFTSLQCHGTMCSLGVLCGALIFLLVVAAGVAFVVRYCRRRRSEREDEKRLLQRQLR